jgi:hypothetical protein
MGYLGKFSLLHIVFFVVTAFMIVGCGANHETPSDHKNQSAENQTQIENEQTSPVDTTVNDDITSVDDSDITDQSQNLSERDTSIPPNQQTLEDFRNRYNESISEGDSSLRLDQFNLEASDAKGESYSAKPTSDSEIIASVENGQLVTVMFFKYNFYEFKRTEDMVQIYDALVNAITPGNDATSILSTLDASSQMLSDGSASSVTQIGSYRYGNLYKSGTDMYTIVNTDLTGS